MRSHQFVVQTALLLLKTNFFLPLVSSSVVLDGLEDDRLLTALPKVYRGVTTVLLVVLASFGNPRGDSGALASKRPHLGSAMGKRPDIVDPQYFEVYVHGVGYLHGPPPN